MAIAQPIATDTLNNPAHSALHRVIAADTAATVQSITVSTTQTAIKPSTDATTGIQLQKTDGTNVLNVDTINSNVGIGTATPNGKLEVSGTSVTGGTRLILSTNDGIAGNSAILWRGSGNTTQAFIGSNYNVGDVGNLEFATGGTGTKVIINSTGNVGIGTATPAQKFNLKNGHIRLDQVAAPTASTVAVGAVGILTGNYYYRITFVTALGETETGTASALVAPSSQQVNLSAIPVSSDPEVTARKIYRTTAGGSNILCQLVATIADNTTTTYSDNIADGSLGVAESKVNTTGGVIYNGTTRSGIIDNSATAIGMNALRVNTGASNSAMGMNALYSNTTGNYNSAMGMNALYSNTTGNYNSAMGRDALRSNTTGSSNSFLGYAAGYNANQKVNAVNSMGLGANTFTTASNQVVIGDTAITETLLKRTGTVKANRDILTLENTGNAADMDGTQTSILFKQWYYDATTPAVANAGRITIGAETDWTSTAATQNSYMSFKTALDGVITEQARVDSSVTAGQTRFLIYDVDNATLERVTVGAADSGGSGFKLLRIPN